MDNQHIFESVACVIRTWSNNPDIVKAVARALRAGIGHVIVVVKDDSPAHFGCVEGWLEGQIGSNPSRITILPMRIGYSWSNALNYAFDEIRRYNMRAAVDGTTQVDFVLNTSNEALYERSHLESMLGEMTVSDQIVAVGAKFNGRKNGNAVELGKTYNVYPRNTLMLVRFSAYLTVGGYSPRCDQLGGQEDFHWLKLIEQVGLRWVWIEEPVDLIVGANFNQAVKERRELLSMTAIMEMNAEIGVGLARGIKNLQ